MRAISEAPKNPERAVATASTQSTKSTIPHPQNASCLKTSLLLVGAVAFCAVILHFLLPSFANNNPKVRLGKTTVADGYITGEIQNTSGSTLRQLEVAFDLFDYGGVRVGTGTDFVDELPQAENWRYRVWYRDNNASKYRLREVKSSKGTLIKGDATAQLDL